MTPTNRSAAGMAGQDPKLVFKLTKMVTEGLIMEDTSRNNGLNYRKICMPAPSG
jgi:hypothetical protein